MSEYQLFPALSPTERDALRNDIEARGVVVPVLVDENNIILDGHHRVEIAQALGIDFPVQAVAGLSEAEKLELVFSLNIARRHLSGHDRTAVIAQCRKRGMSLRAIAEVVGVSPATVYRDLSVSDETPEVEDAPAPVEPPPEPLPRQPTRAERVRDLLAEGKTQVAIAVELGVAPSTVSNIVNKKLGQADAASDTPADWPAVRGLVKSLDELREKDARRLAASVPDRNRRATAERLRRAGRVLVSIAYELEQEVTP